MLNKALAPMQRIHAERMTSFGEFLSDSLNPTNT